MASAPLTSNIQIRSVKERKNFKAKVRNSLQGNTCRQGVHSPHNLDKPEEANQQKYTSEIIIYTYLYDTIQPIITIPNQKK